jgi:predicted phosphodiesterase
MKIQIASDIHLEFNDNYYKIFDDLEPTADILVIAGDLSPFYGYYDNRIYRDSGTVEKFIEWAKPKWKKIIRVTGNHEYWRNPIFEKTYKHTQGNFITLDQGIVKFGDVTFICATGWGTFKMPDEEWLRKLHFIDYELIENMDFKMYKALGMKHRKFIMDSVRKATGKVVIVTHHMPSQQLIDDEFKKYVDSNPFFAMDYDNFLEKYQDKIDCWIYGHSHRFRDEVINGVRTVRNPFAYPRERNFYGDKVYKQNFTIEV